MNISEIFIKKPVMTVLVTLAVTLFGVSAYFMLPISDLPETPCPVIQITTNWPGASAETMALNVSMPIENQCMQIQGLNGIISQNTIGQSLITLTFDLSVDVDMAAPDVQGALWNAQSNLPDDLPAPPSYQKVNPSDLPIIYIMVKSNLLNPGDVYDVANKTIGQRISMLYGISQVQVWSAQGAIRVRVDPKRLAAYSLGIDDVARTLKQATITLPGGNINGENGSFTIIPNGELTEPAEYDELIVKYVKGAPVRIKDIGKSVYLLQDEDLRNAFYQVGDKNLTYGGTVLAVFKRPGTNAVDLCARVHELLADIKTDIPAAVDVVILYDRSVTVKSSIEDVKSTLYIAFFLVIFVIFIFLGSVRDTVIPGFALPISMVCTTLIMYLVGFSLDNISLMALTLAVGFVVDDAIVVLENTVRLTEEGLSPFQAAVKSASEISGTVISMTLSLVTVFIPIMFMGGIVGKTFREFAMTIIFAILCSGVISLTLTPMMCARMLEEKSKAAKSLLKKAVDGVFGVMIAAYKFPLKLCLRFRFVPLLAWVACIVGTLYLLKLVPTSFLPIGDSGIIIGLIQCPLGTSTSQMSRYQDQLNEVLKRNPHIHHFFTLIGSTPGADQSQGKTVISLKPVDQRPPIDQVIMELSKEIRDVQYPLGTVFFMPYPVIKIATGGSTTATGAKYSYTISGVRSDQVYDCTFKMEKRLRELPGIFGLQNSVKLNMPQVALEIMRDKASTYGISAQDLESSLCSSLAGAKCTQYITNVDQYYLILEYGQDYRKEPFDLTKMYISSTKTGDLIPLSSIATWTESVTPQTVIHSQQLITGSLSFNIMPGVPLGNVTKGIEDAAKDILPAGVNGVFEGEAQEFSEALASMPLLVAIAVFLMYVILGVLYESYIHPFTVLTTLPVAAFGGLLTLLVFRSELSLYADIGLFMLLGIVAKNGIMMVDFANAKMEEGGLSAHDAIYEACLIRFRPILMTSAAAIMGALPIAIGFGADPSSRRPLGLIVAGGLLFAQIITLFVTPVIYYYMQIVQEKFLDNFELTRSEAGRRRMSKTAEGKQDAR